MTDLRQGVTRAMQRLLDALDQLEELGVDATAWADAAIDARGDRRKLLAVAALAIAAVERLDRTGKTGANT